MKQIPRFPNYLITKDGRIWSDKCGQWLKLTKSWKGYLTIKSNRTTYQVHRLVLETYVGPCPDGMECRHLNGDPSDNRLENLCWGTRHENMLDAKEHGTINYLNTSEREMVFHSYHYGGYTMQELADAYCVARTTIGKIVRTYKPLPVIL